MRHILLLENNTDHADLIRRALTEASPPSRISHAATLAAGRAMAEAELPDLALVDDCLPDGSGEEFVAWTADRFPIVVLTASGQQPAAKEAIKAGALDYAIKSADLFADMAHLVERSLRDWKNQHERRQAESRLEAINHLLATMGPNFVENVSRLVALLAREFGAQFAFYSQVSGTRLCAVAQWHVDLHLAGCVRCGCPACTEALNYAAGQMQHLQTAQENPLSDPLTLCVSPTHAHLGHVVECHQAPVGILCLFFTRPYHLTDTDRRLLAIFAAALGGEENRKRTAAELRAVDERYRQIVQTANEGIWVTDEKDRLTFANLRLARMLGYLPEELLQQPAVNFVDPSEFADHQFRLQTARQGQSSQYECRLRHKDGRELWAWVSGSPLFDELGRYRGGFAMFTDVTERRHLESQLRQAQKLESVGQLAGGIAHDFNNILAAIMMHLSLLRHHPSLEPETTESLKELELETRRAANLTRQLLMFSRRGVIQARLLDLNELVQNLTKMLQRLLGEHIKIEFDSFNGLPSVKVDGGMIEQVLMNFAVNARDAMPKGGRLTIATRLVELDEAARKLNSERRAGTFVLLSVADDGVGMDDGTLKRIFEPFFTTKDVGKGTGLGLPTAHGIVKQHHGWIEVQSHLGQGSTFTVYLPAEHRGAAPAEAPPLALPVLGGQGTLLLVEDEDIVRRPIGAYLRKLGYEVLEAANGNQAFHVWKDHRDQIDLLYTDMVMPEGVSGLDLAEKLRGDKPQLRVIISSGYNNEFSMQGVPADANYLYLPKPSTSTAIAAAVRECLHGK